MKRLLLLAVMVLGSGWVSFPTLWPAPLSAAAAEEPWKIEFDLVCGQSDNAAELSVDELKKAVARCDALKPQIEALEATPRKVYLKRLQMCRNLFVFLLASKENGTK